MSPDDLELHGVRILVDGGRLDAGTAESGDHRSAASTALSLSSKSSTSRRPIPQRPPLKQYAE